MIYLLIYLCVINLVGFVIMYMDKKKAIKHRYRISEKTLFVVAIIGGSVGSIIGMHMFRHKTKHWYFVYGMPAIFILQMAVAIMIGLNAYCSKGQ